MPNIPPHHDVSISAVVHGAVGHVLSDASLADKVTQAVLAALEEYEDAAFANILKETEEDGRVSIDVIKAALKS